MVRKMIFAIVTVFQACAFLAIVDRQASAAQIALSPIDVIGGSGSYGNPTQLNSFSSGQFNATQILDAQSGAVTEPSQNGYWLNPDNGPANAYITVDLGTGNDSGLQFELFNTSNAQYQDRGTGNFTIVGGNTVTLDPTTNGYVLSGPMTTLVTGTLMPASTQESQVSPAGIPGQYFTALDGGSFRYIEFEPTSVASFGASCCGANNYGLNEIRVFATPEPGSLIAVLGLSGMGLIGFLLRRYKS